MADLILIRGLPGSGQEELAEKFKGYQVFSMYDFFEDPDTGEFDFDFELVTEAHEDCQQRTKYALEHDEKVIVINTFAQRWEIQYYLDIAQNCQVRPTVIDLFNGGYTDVELEQRNRHGIRFRAILNKRKCWEHNWSVGLPKPPWER